MKRDKNKAQADRHALLAAAALQDHMARRLRMPGGPVVQPSLQPGAPMTLAQHLGLIPRPPPLLSEDQWTEVHLRSRLRQDSAHECVICREEFQAGAQVLLSCSHTFHRHCLAAFERFSRSKSCPLCRAQQYQKKIIRDGEELYRTKCATRIQAAWRGYAARRSYAEYRRHNPPRDERLRKRWAAERLQEENDRLLTAMDAEVGDLDDLFAELDASVAASRAVYDAALRPLAARLQRDLIREAVSERELQRPAGAAAAAAAAAAEAAEEEQEKDGSGPSASERAGSAALPLPLLESGLVAPALARPSRRERPVLLAAATAATTSPAARIGRGPGGGGGGGSSSTGGGVLPAAVALMYAPTSTSPAEAATATAVGAVAAAVAAGRPATAAEVDWDAVVARARSRGSLECPICLGNISRRGNEGIAWLSCTHCFHVDCIMAFEAFELASGGALSCPMCRSGYRRRCFV